MRLSLAGRTEPIWQKIEEDIQSLKPKLRKEAAQLLDDLRNLALRQKTMEQYRTRLTALLKRHRSRWAFLRERKKVGLLDADGNLPSSLDVS